MNSNKSLPLRHAEYYQELLRRLNELFDSGGVDNATSTLNDFDADWPQIQVAQQYVADNSNENRLAQYLCKIFYDAGTEIIIMRLSATERIKWLENAIQAAIKLGDRQAESASLGNQAIAYIEIGEYDKGLDNLQKAIQLAEKFSANEDLIVIQFHNMANALIYQGRVDEALVHFDEMLKRVTENKLKATIQLGQGISLIHTGQFKEARCQIDHALTYAQSQKQLTLLEKCFNAYGTYYFTLGRFEKAEAAFQNALEIALELKNTKAMSYLYSNISNIYLFRHDYEKVVEFAHEAVKFAIDAKYGESQAVALTMLAQGYAFLGNYSEALNAFEASFELDNQYQNWPQLYENLIGASNILCGSGQLERAKDYLNQSRIIAHKLPNYETLIQEINVLEGKIQKHREAQLAGVNHTVNLTTLMPLTEVQQEIHVADTHIQDCKKTLPSKRNLQELEKAADLALTSAKIYETYGLVEEVQGAKQIADELWRKIKNKA